LDAVVRSLLMMFWGLEPAKRQPARVMIER
jgi:hypothetical protein